MDIQKELNECNNWLLEQDDDFVTGYGQGNYALGLARLAWQAAKAQAVPEGFVLVPVTPSDEFIDKLADVICNEFDTTISGSAHCATEAYKLMIESQEPAND